MFRLGPSQDTQWAFNFTVIGFPSAVRSLPMLFTSYFDVVHRLDIGSASRAHICEPVSELELVYSDI
jgi:hypothetical protein